MALFDLSFIGLSVVVGPPGPDICSANWEDISLPPAGEHTHRGHGGILRAHIVFRRIREMRRTRRTGLEELRLAS
jgi:hypothetical protein